MRERVTRPWRVTRMWVALLMVGQVAAQSSPAPTREDLQRAMAQLQEVTYQHFDHPRSMKVRAFIDEGHAQILALARTAPDTRRIAQVIFRRGADGRRVQEMAKEFRLSVHEVALLFTVRDGRDFANTLPSQFLWGRQMALSEVIARFIADHRAEFRRLAAQVRQDPSPHAAEGARYYESLAKSGVPLLVRVRVTAAADMLRLVSEEADIYAVVMNPSAESARRLDEARSLLENPTAIQDVTDL